MNGKDIYENDILSDGQDKYLVWIEAGKVLIGDLHGEWDKHLSPFIHTKRLEIITEEI